MNTPMGYIPNPTVIEQTARGERQYDIYSRLLLDRIVYFGTEVNSVTANLAVAQLLFLDQSDPTAPIHMYINSPGGEVYSGLAIIDAMNHIQAPVYTYCVGLAASMGSLILQAGEKGHRYSMPNSRIMIHQPLGGARGQATDIEIQAKEILELRENLYKIYENHNTKGQTVADFHKHCERDNYLSPSKAMELGLIDHIIESKKVKK